MFVLFETKAFPLQTGEFPNWESCSQFSRSCGDWGNTNLVSVGTQGLLKGLDKISIILLGFGTKLKLLNVVSSNLPSGLKPYLDTMLFASEQKQNLQPRRKVWTHLFSFRKCCVLQKENCQDW